MRFELTNIVSKTKNNVIDLNVHKIELNWVVSIYIDVRKEELLPEQQHLLIRDALFSQAFLVVQPQNVIIRMELFPQSLHFLPITLLYSTWLVLRIKIYKRLWQKKVGRIAIRLTYTSVFVRMVCIFLSSHKVSKI